ncbi:hypothetical protein D7316_03811 [Gordonia insulae]|uniref:Uncharacterized protein n=1 Tax=Gordonia insulae TaxID=2420509 RepID=A0A3G8JQJ6_9ACTN|nr:hypothetical protein D7316_03811 [Gordonia insulae]
MDEFPFAEPRRSVDNARHTGMLRHPIAQYSLVASEMTFAGSADATQLQAKFVG